MSVRWEPPYSGGVPAYISDRRAESLNQIYGFRTSVRDGDHSRLIHLHSERGDRHPASELDAVEELKQTGDRTQEKVLKPVSGKTR